MDAKNEAPGLQAIPSGIVTARHNEADGSRSRTRYAVADPSCATTESADQTDSELIDTKPAIRASPLDRFAPVTGRN